MKVCVTIPAYNEEETVGEVVEECKKVLEDEGYENEILVIDDGSTDSTAEVAREAGAEVISHHTNRGLGRTFSTALRHALRTDADTIVNIDADMQYDPKDLPLLLKPVEDREADLVLGTRDVLSLEHMPLTKKVGNKIGSIVTSLLSGTRIRDAQTGYRAASRDLASRLNLFGTYTYVQESIIQASHKGFDISQVPVNFRKRESGDSRLISSLPQYIKNAAGIVIRTYRDYRPMRTFSLIAALFFVLAAVPGYQVITNFLATGHFELVGRGLIFILLSLGGALTLVFGLMADMLKTQRELQEEILHEVRTS